MGGEDLLEKEVMTQSSILAWEIPWIALVGYSPWGRKGLDMTEQQAWHDMDIYTHMEQRWASSCARYVHFSLNIYHSCIF